MFGQQAHCNGVESGHMYACVQVAEKVHIHCPEAWCRLLALSNVAHSTRCRTPAATAAAASVALSREWCYADRSKASYCCKLEQICRRICLFILGCVMSVTAVALWAALLHARSPWCLPLISGGSTASSALPSTADVACVPFCNAAQAAAQHVDIIIVGPIG